MARGMLKLVGRVAGGTLAAVLLTACDGGCRDSAPNGPSGSAGEILERAIAAAGGWERWAKLKDVAYATTFTLYGPLGEVRSETIGIQKSPLHGSPRARFEPLGMTDRLVLGFDGKEAWALRGTRPPPEGDRMVFARFNMVSNVFWFSLPFSLAEMPASVVDLGVEAHDGVDLHRLRVTLDEDAPEAPGDWFVIYFDSRTDLIDRVLAHVTAPFLSHELWLGRWLDYQDWDGIRKERRRQFFPADEGGRLIGEMVVDQFVEDVRFNNDFAADIFEKPALTQPGDEV
jgi:hypothetical protein